MFFSLVIPNHNGTNLLSKSLPSFLLALKNLPSNIKYEIILVDNASTDQSLKITKKIFPNTNLIRNKENTGFATAVNQGIKESKGEWVVILNNDLILHKNWFKKIHETIKNQAKQDLKIKTIFGQVLDKDGLYIESQGLKFFKRAKALNVKNNQKYKTTKDKPKLIWGASASAVCYHRQTILNLGLFDQDFFAYEEDVDLSLRLDLSGYKTLFQPQAISYHTGGATSSKMGNLRARLDTRNWFYIIFKNYSLKTIFKNLLPILTERLRNLSYLIKETAKIYGLRSVYHLPFSILSVYFQVIINLPRMIKKRKDVSQKI